MRSYILTAVGVAAVVTAGMLFFVRQERYALVAQAGKGEYVYKIDKVTGRVWFIEDDIIFGLRDRDALRKSVTPEDEAIGFANTSEMADTIKKWLQAKKGPLRVQGWNAKKIDDQTYLVGYSYDEGPGTKATGWIFEVNLKAQIVRDVVGDTDLEKKYAGWAQSLEKKNSGVSYP